MSHMAADPYTSLETNPQHQVRWFWILACVPPVARAPGMRAPSSGVLDRPGLASDRS